MNRCKRTLIRHVGSITSRTGPTLDVDPATGNIIGDADGQAFWRREYRPGWEPRV